MKFEDKIKNKLLMRGFPNKILLNNRGLICATTDETILEVVKEQKSREMKKIEHIKIGSDNKLFDWLLRDERHGTWSERNSQMIRELVKRHNEMADALNKYSNLVNKLLNETPKK